MNSSLSQNTQAILLLTAPLVAGRKPISSDSPDLLKPSEYKRLARFLREKQWQPADFLTPNAEELIEACQGLVDKDRLRRLLGRGFLLSQAVERWQTRAIWVVSRADSEYPRRLKNRLKEDAPAILYGCGERAILDAGGLAVVGSRHVDDALIAYTKDVSALTAKARHTLVSGGARGIDQAAMCGALEAGGKVTGVLSDGLEKAVLNREHRDLLMSGQLLLISPYDPSAGFNVGHAMQRNKLIYALADAALVVSSDFEKGGTWAGAIEQLDKLQLVPVYVRSGERAGKGIEALQKKGAMPWPEPKTPEALSEALAIELVPQKKLGKQYEFPFLVREEPEPAYEVQSDLNTDADSHVTRKSESPLTPAEELFVTVRKLLTKMAIPKTDVEIASDLQVSKPQASKWLKRLVKEGVIQKYTKPVRYGPK